MLDTATGQSIALPEQTTESSSISFSADGKSAAVASFGDNDGVIVVDVATGQERDRLVAGSYHALFSRLGNLLVTGSSSLSVRDMETATDLTRIELLDSARILDWSRDGELLAVGTGERDGSTSVFQVGSWRRLARFRRLGVPVEGIAISPDGSLIASTANRKTTVFETRQGSPLGQVGKPGRPGRLAYNAERHIVAGLLDKETVIVFTAGTDRELVRLDHCSSRVLALSADGSRLAAGCGSTARIVDLSTGAVIGEVPMRHDKLAISPDGRLVFSIGPQGATVYEAAGGREVKVIGGDSVKTAAFSANRLAIALGGSGVRLFDVPDALAPVVPKPFADHELIESLAFSPDGKLLALGARNRFATVYDLLDPDRSVARFDHKEEEKEVLQVESMVFSADGRLLATAAVDPTTEHKATLRVFDLRTETELMRVPLAEDPILIRISPDNAFLEIVVGWKNLRLERFPLDGRALIEDACTRVSRNLTESEWTRYFGDAPYRKTCDPLNPASLEIQ